MKYGFMKKIQSWVDDFKNVQRLKKIGKFDDFVQSKRFLKGVLNNSENIFDVSQKLELNGYWGEIVEDFNPYGALNIAVASKRFLNGSVELSLFENVKGFSSKRVIVLMYYYIKGNDLKVLNFGGVFVNNN